MVTEEERYAEALETRRLAMWYFVAAAAVTVFVVARTAVDPVVVDFGSGHGLHALDVMLLAITFLVGMWWAGVGLYCRRIRRRLLRAVGEEKAIGALITAAHDAGDYMERDRLWEELFAVRKPYGRGR